MPLNFSGTDIEALYRQLQSSAQGLDSNLAASKLAEQKSKLKTPSRASRELKLLIRQFTNPLVLLLVVAVILSAILGEVSDTLIILFILLATGLLSFWQELNAGRAVERLQQMIKLKCNVLRDGTDTEVDADAIVPGDILLLNAGGVIPADCRLIEHNELHVNESSITGESYPVEKAPGIVADSEPISAKTNCLWQGTNVVSGTGKALVVNTGGDTVFGQMAHSLVTVQETAFEKGIKHFGYFLMQITIVLSIVILSVNLYFKKPLFDSILFALAIAVGMAPELLPAIMTFAMSAGAKRMLKKKVIVKKLSSIFNFGEVEILCTDKTGTITEGVIKVKDVIDIGGKSSEQAKQLVFLNSVFQNGFSNPIDDAIKSLGLGTEGYSKINEIPYDFIRRRLSIGVTKDGKQYLISKGAVDNILEVCTQMVDEKGTISAIDKGRITALYKDYCSDGFRLIGICYKEMNTEKVSKEDERDMIFMGFVVLEDPLKADTIATLDRLKQLNVKVKIITGDNQYVAGYAAKKIGIAEPVVLSGGDIARLTPEALVVKAANTDVFAEVEPQQKEHIIKALQKSKYTIAYMGDGINDVAAIHAADTGISTNNATDVAKEAADFVLLEKDLSVLADGIEEGRKTFINSLKYIFINTGATFGNMFSVAGASLLLPFLPMLPKQILLTNFITDLPYITIASDNVDEEQLKKPRKWNMRVIRNFMIVFGLHSSIFDFLTFYVLYQVFKLRDSPFQTGWFVESVVTELCILFIIRTRKSFIASRPGKFLMISSFIALVITLALPFSPFAAELGLSVASISEVMAIGLIILAYVITADLLKLAFFRIYKND
ncbi:MAG: magnesium-translocating P-type ATPase [Bacteroidetes bacterium]|nr:magnesium-translocating P-type ATPase [Bacteroidota bacterium]